MAVPFSSDEVVEKVRDATSLPDAHWIDATKILSFADEEVESLLGARVKTAREGHWQKLEDAPIVAGTLRYRIPRRAFGRAVTSIALVSLSSGQVSPLTEIDAALASSFPASSSPGPRVRYYGEDDEIVFPSQPPVGYAVRFRYLRRPSRLVPVSEASGIVLCEDIATLFVESAIPDWLAAQVQSGFEPTLTPPPLYVDIVRGTAPFDLSAVDLLLSYITVSSREVTFLSTLTPASFVDRTAITNDRVDYICLRDQTVYPQLPAELFPTLVSAVGRRVLEALGDRPGAELAQASMRERGAAASAIIEPRNQDRSRPIVNRFSPLRGGGRGRGGGWWPGS